MPWNFKWKLAYLTVLLNINLNYYNLFEKFMFETVSNPNENPFKLERDHKTVKKN